MCCENTASGIGALEWSGIKKPSNIRRALEVPLTGHFSNPFFANVDELLVLRDSLKDEGLLDRLTAIPAITEQGASSPIPYRP